MEILHINSNYCQDGTLKSKYINTFYKIKLKCSKSRNGAFLVVGDIYWPRIWRLQFEYKVGSLYEKVLKIHTMQSKINELG